MRCTYRGNHQHAYARGFNRATDGGKRTSCPYSADALRSTGYRNAWLNGFDDGFRALYKLHECEGCGAEWTVDKLTKCPLCERTKCPHCDMGDDVMCGLCEEEQ